MKFDRYRAVAFKDKRQDSSASRNDNDFSMRYSGVVKGLAKLPDEPVIDGEAMALDDDGRRSFNLLQNYGSSIAALLYFVLDGGPGRSRWDARAARPINDFPQQRSGLSVSP